MSDSEVWQTDDDKRNTSNVDLNHNQEHLYSDQHDGDAKVKTGHESELFEENIISDDTHQPSMSDAKANKQEVVVDDDADHQHETMSHSPVAEGKAMEVMKDVRESHANNEHISSSVHEEKENTEDESLLVPSPTRTSPPFINRTPSFLMPTLSMLAPKIRDSYEEFPDSPASKRGVMMKTGAADNQTQFDSIFLYDDKVKEKDAREKLLLERKKKEADIQNIPRLFRPTMSSLAQPPPTIEADTITKRGTMMQTTAPQFTSKFALMIQTAQQVDLDLAKKSKKEPIPYEAFEDALSPVNKGHTFNTALPPQKKPLPHEAFSECIKSPLEDRIRQAMSLSIQEIPPRVMKPSIPFEAFVASPVKPPPVVPDNKSIKTLKQLHHFMKKKVTLVEYSLSHIHSEWVNIIASELQIEIDLTKAEWENEVPIPHAVLYILSLRCTLPSCRKASDLQLNDVLVVYCPDGSMCPYCH